MPSGRTEQKLRYARIHLQELEDYENKHSNDDWENAHQDSFFYHLAGSVEGILHEINAGYCLELKLTNVSTKSVERALKKSTSPAFNEIAKLRNDTTSWLAQLYVWRNHGTHRNRVPKIVQLSTCSNPDNEFKDPRTGQPSKAFSGLGCVDTLRRLVDNVRSLIGHCRSIDPRLSKS